MHYAEIFRSKSNGQWYYRVKAMNGETIAQSEGYTLKWSAKRAVKKNHPDVREIRVE